MSSRSAVQCSRGAEGDGVTRAEVGKEELMQQQHSLHLVEQWQVKLDSNREVKLLILP